MTFGSGSNGCLGHGSLNDISQVGACVPGDEELGSGQGLTSGKRHPSWRKGALQQPQVVLSLGLHLSWVVSGKVPTPAP